MSWTNAVVTEAGLALQAKLVDGQTLGFLRVAAGTGTVDPAALANQTALVNEKQTLTFQPPNVLDGAKIKVPVMLNNIGLETGYTMQQLGFFADDPDDGEILYAIVQDEVGDTVPSQTESPGFVIEWAFVFQYGNADSVAVTLDPVGLVSIGMVGQPGGVAGLGENGAVPIEQGGTGATTAQDAVLALGALFAIAAAAAYNSSGTYAIGDYCTNDGNLYKCNTPIESGEPWNSEHWTETTVAAELAEVRASLANMFAKTYTAPSQIGITLGSETIESISTALPNGAMLMYGVGESANTEIYPFRLCTIIVYRIDASRVVWTAIDKSTGKNATGNWSNDLGFTGWAPKLPEKRSLPLADGWIRVNAAEYWVTQENVVIVTFRVAPENGVAIDTSTKIIATLPEGFRPVGCMPHISVATMKSGEKGNDAQAWIDEIGNIYAQAVTPIPATSGGIPVNWGGFAGTFVFVVGNDLAKG